MREGVMPVLFCSKGSQPGPLCPPRDIWQHQEILPSPNHISIYRPRAFLFPPSATSPLNTRFSLSSSNTHIKSRQKFRKDFEPIWRARILPLHSPFPGVFSVDPITWCTVLIFISKSLTSRVVKFPVFQLNTYQHVSGLYVKCHRKL